MYESRRMFLGASVSAFAVAALGARLQSQRQQSAPPTMVPASRPPFPNDPTLVPEVPKPDSRTLKANQEAIKKDIARMTELVQQLHEGLDAHDTSEVLSLDVLKKCDEIEKLAKQVRSMVRG